MPANSLRVLILGDQPANADQIVQELKKNGFQPAWQRVNNENDFMTSIAALPEVVIAEQATMQFPGVNALKRTKERGLDVPFIMIVSDSTSEGEKETMLRLGASDCLPSQRLSQIGAAVALLMEKGNHQQPAPVHPVSPIAPSAVATKEALPLNEKQILRLLDNSPNGVYALDHQWRFTYANPSVSQLIDRTSESLLGKNIWDEFPDLLGTPFFSNFRRAVDSRAARKFEEFYPYTNKWLEVIADPWEDGLAVHLQDITSRRQHELEQKSVITVARALQESTNREEVMKILLDQLTVLFKTDNMLVVLVNHLTKELVGETGRGRGEPFVGKSITPGQGVTPQVIVSRKPYNHYDAFTDPQFAQWRDLPRDARSVACVPLATREEVLGSFWLEREDEFSDSDIKVMLVISDVAASAVRRVLRHEKIEQWARQMTIVRDCDTALSASVDSQTAFTIIFDQVMTQLKADAVNVLMLDADRIILQCVASRGFKTEEPRNARLRANEGHAGQVLQERSPIYLPSLIKDQGSKARVKQLAGEGFHTYCAAPLISRGQLKGVLEVFYRSPQRLGQEQIDLLATLARHGATVVDGTQLFEEIQRRGDELAFTVDSIIETWVHALDLRDQESGGHTKRVTEMAVRLGRSMGVDEENLQHIRRGAMLHDIGKIFILDSILRKETKLNDDEWEIMRKHPVYAYTMLSPIPFLRTALDIPYCHHERWDGTGYPRHLKGDQIPLAARIFTVVDVWDSLTSDRPFRKKWPEVRVRVHIHEESGWHFDPDVVVAFAKLLEAAPQPTT